MDEEVNFDGEVSWGVTAYPTEAAITHSCTDCELHSPLGCRGAAPLDYICCNNTCIGQPSKGLNKWPIKWVIL